MRLSGEKKKINYTWASSLAARRQWMTIWTGPAWSCRCVEALFPLQLMDSERFHLQLPQSVLRLMYELLSHFITPKMH